MNITGVQVAGVRYLALESLCNWLTKVAETVDESEAHQAASDITRGIRDVLAASTSVPA